MHLAAYRLQLWDFVNMWMDLRVPIPAASFLAANASTFEEISCIMKFI